MAFLLGSVEIMVVKLVWLQSSWILKEELIGVVLLRGNNSRIERLWRDDYYGVIQTSYAMFYYLESKSVLGVDIENDLFCIRNVLLSRINNALHEFKEAYNHHGLSTGKKLKSLHIVGEWHDEYKSTEQFSSSRCIEQWKLSTCQKN